MGAVVSLPEISRRLSRQVNRLRFGPPITHVYNPLRYAWAAHEAYLEGYGAGRGRVLLLGMNPGPFGMAQTGVPFGDVALVRDFLGIERPVGRPEREHPARPIEGFACRRSEVSGTRLWGWAKARYGTAARFFTRFFVMNYCPLVFIEPPAKNRTPDKLPREEREPLYAACDDALRAVVEALEPRAVVGVGAFAQGRAKAALADRGLPVLTILHPSPASPLANRGWAVTIERQLTDAGIAL
jgi:single-strand selective monofunctional uracil DNA glycosylase